MDRRGPGHGRALLAVALVGLLGAAACSKSSSPTSPYGGGGGGTGGGGGGTPVLALGPFGLSQSAQVTFTNAGTFGYHCIPHQSMGMVGSVQVDAAGADSQLVQIGLSGLSYSPATAHIKPGGYVRWVNVSGFTIHTVTSN